VLNTLAFAFMLVMNSMRPSRLHELSHTHETLLTPVDCAFKIWYLIFVLIGLFVLRLWIRPDQLRDPARSILPRLTPLFVTNMLLGGTFNSMFLCSRFLLCLGMLSGMLVTLIGMYSIVNSSLRRMNAADAPADGSTCSIRACLSRCERYVCRVMWVSVYMAWVTCLTITCLELVLKYTLGWPPLLRTEFMTSALLLTLLTIAALTLSAPPLCDAAFACTISWALLGIGRKGYGFAALASVWRNSKESTLTSLYDTAKFMTSELPIGTASSGADMSRNIASLALGYAVIVLVAGAIAAVVRTIAAMHRVTPFSVIRNFTRGNKSVRLF